MEAPPSPLITGLPPVATRPNAASARQLRLAHAAAGAVAATAAIGTGELIAGLVGGAPSLVIAIGDLVISLQPPGAKEFVVSLFGLNDKLALNVAIVISALAIAAVIGILAARRFAVGIAAFGVAGAIAFTAALGDPLVTPLLALLTSVLAVAVGLGVLRWLLSLAQTPTTTASAVMPDWDRRRFVIASAGTLGGAIVAGSVGRALLDQRHAEGAVVTTRLPAALQPVPPPDPDQSFQADGLSPLVVPNEDFYRIDTALLVPRVDPASWTLAVNGLVDRPLSFTYDQLLAMPLFEQYVTIACVSNRVGGDLVGNALWTGVRLKDLLEMAGVQPVASQIIGRSVDGFTAGFPTAWATEPGREAMVAVGMNREPLPVEHGYPARLIVPGLYGYVSATKWLAAIELTTREAVDGYWIPLGWAKDAPILTQSRIDTPGDGSRVSAGQATIAGVAWAPDRGIAGVEIRIDDEAWRPARISRPISPATWVQWELDWVASAGHHRIEVRAIDGTGDIQTELQSEPAPDGARGHHRISVVVG